jgi:hypothetical protein
MRFRMGGYETAVYSERLARGRLVQCLEVDVASQGENEEEALANLREALELYFEPPTPTDAPHIRSIEAEIGVA